MNLTDYGEITALLKRHGFRFSKSLGQNFLVADWVPVRIAEESGVTKDDGVLEIGPGIGCLTVELSKRAAAVNSLELDRSLAPILRETLAECPNVTVTYEDALKTDLETQCRETLGERPWKVCANLPYNVTTPVLTKLLEANCFDSITVMIQKEVAERLAAAPGTAEYGAFTVLVNWYAECEKLFDVPPSCFVPQPKVTSSVVRMKRRSAPPAAVRDKAFLFRVVRAAFGQRRKTLSNALSAGLPGLTRQEAEECIVSLGLPAQVRGERLSLAEFAALSDAIGSVMHAEGRAL